MLWSKRRSLTGLVLAVSLLGLAASPIQHAQAAGDDALQVLKAMSDYLASQKTISATFEFDPRGHHARYGENSVCQLGHAAHEPPK